MTLTLNSDRSNVFGYETLYYETLFYLIGCQQASMCLCLKDQFELCELCQLQLSNLLLNRLSVNLLVFLSQRPTWTTWTKSTLHNGSIRIQCQCHDPKQRRTPMFSLWPRDSEMTFRFFPDPRKKINYIEVMIYSLEMTVSLKWKKFLGSGTKRKVTSESVGHKENVGVLCCFGSWHWHGILIDPMWIVIKRYAKDSLLRWGCQLGCWRSPGFCPALPWLSCRLRRCAGDPWDGKFLKTAKPSEPPWCCRRKLKHKDKKLLYNFEMFVSTRCQYILSIYFIFSQFFGPF